MVLCSPATPTLTCAHPWLRWMQRAACWGVAVRVAGRCGAARRACTPARSPTWSRAGPLRSVCDPRLCKTGAGACGQASSPPSRKCSKGRVVERVLGGAQPGAPLRAPAPAAPLQQALRCAPARLPGPRAHQQAQLTSPLTAGSVWGAQREGGGALRGSARPRCHCRAAQVVTPGRAAEFLRPAPLQNWRRRVRAEPQPPPAGNAQRTGS
jgi:hypothetical protein